MCHAWLSIARGQNERNVILCQDRMKVKKNQDSNKFCPAVINKVVFVIADDGPKLWTRGH